MCWSVYIFVELKDGSMFFEYFISEEPDRMAAIKNAFEQAFMKYFKRFDTIACCGPQSAKLLDARSKHAL